VQPNGYYEVWPRIAGWSFSRPMHVWFGGSLVLTERC
jgi:hypothetical protein